ncbi:MAG: hypothetical protein G01um101418_616 [Parcubacteria group bacterium Gr01-1014_18]|nr:MAG: hypothetical protein Greene041636_93 [Parcubacteria group bacterium Greene0416_36]TSC80868.1 MAG: hypothetical protein G01um101418_616 [Parcubacteria group bacterium Gr01-1014_18]TSC99529.1 MAG: hypothetical protein Greene101420_196 [Parcubacteria group bacterium Greene1014_20]TSD07552.1 MAG: hypothetical protein Greene07142_9 [Parcubacteria group bacterium Greene0714_2]
MAHTLSTIKILEKLRIHRVSIFISLSLIVIGLFYAFVFSPQWTRILKMKEDIRLGTIRWEESEKYLRDLKIQHASYQKYSEILNRKMDILLPGSVRSSDLIVSLEAIARENGMRLLGIDVAPEAEGAGSKKFSPGISGFYPSVFTVPALGGGEATPALANITLTLAGADYGSLKRFFQALENSLRVLDVVNFSFSPKARELRFVIRTYYLK